MPDDTENHMTGTGILGSIVIAAVHLQRGNGLKGTWWPQSASQFGRGAAITCPECGRYRSLAGHTIRPDGVVVPRVACDNRECDFNEFVILEGWAP